MAKLKITRQFSEDPSDQERAAKAILKALFAIQQREQQTNGQPKKQVG